MITKLFILTLIYIRIIKNKLSIDPVDILIDLTANIGTAKKKILDNIIINNKYFTAIIDLYIIQVPNAEYKINVSLMFDKVYYLY